MFRAARWAAAYTAECARHGEDPATGLGFLRAVVPVLREKAVFVAGSDAAVAVDKFLAAALAKADGIIPLDKKIETARAILFLLIKRSCFHQADLLLQAIEALIQQNTGQLDVIVETAGAGEKPGAGNVNIIEENEAFLSALGDLLKQRYAVTDVRFEVRQRPELIGGYRLRIGSDLFDYSIAGRLAQLESFIRG